MGEQPAREHVTVSGSSPGADGRPVRAPHPPIVRYWHPDGFARLGRAAYALGFEHAATRRFVRSSYLADQRVAQAEPAVEPLARSVQV
ncbi:MAG: hypothetical protein JOZ98_06640 [Solirubrobacterales bacterium]|nr:hypothetical protein [Solirubrobacterales bacterium]MBV9422568.1 hypothetical protein [Solirubrobacterales bacterium]MBV9800152.1 hypothetical protein [Solirubrobacterales bacterium]